MKKIKDLNLGDVFRYADKRGDFMQILLHRRDKGLCAAYGLESLCCISEGGEVTLDIEVELVSRAELAILELQSHDIQMFIQTPDGDFPIHNIQEFDRHINPPPVKKKLDLTALIESGILCSFGDDSGPEIHAMGRLARIDSGAIGSYVDGFGDHRKWCAPVMDYWHSHRGHKGCPIPDGYDIQIDFRGKEQTIVRSGYTNLVGWGHCDHPADIVSFRVLGVNENFEL